MKGAHAASLTSCAEFGIRRVVRERFNRLHRGKGQKRDDRGSGRFSLHCGDVPTSGEVFASMLVHDLVNVLRIPRHPRVVVTSMLAIKYMVMVEIPFREG